MIRGLDEIRGLDQVCGLYQVRGLDMIRGLDWVRSLGVSVSAPRSASRRRRLYSLLLLESVLRSR